jgi:hypothetical protein
MRLNTFRPLLGAALAVALLNQGCVDPDSSGGGSTAGTAIYTFDGSDSPTSGRVLIWNDSNNLYNDPLAAPSRTLSGLAFDKVKTLGLGGMCMDTTGNRLYLVSESGDVARVESVRSKNGTLSSSADVVTFSLGSGSADRLSGSKFGQAAIDPQTSTLFVTETGDSDARIWVVQNPAQYPQNANVPIQTITVAGDKKAFGVAAWLGSVYATFQEGNAVIGGNLVQYNGPRLRKGTSSGFAANTNVIVGTANTMLRKYGAVAYDSGNDQIYVACHLADAGSSAAPIVVFKPGDFVPGLDKAPYKTLGDSSLNNLRILAHGGNKDWLAAATASGESPSNVVYLWRNPQTAATPRTVNLSGAKIRGLAFDGSN